VHLPLGGLWALTEGTRRIDERLLTGFVLGVLATVLLASAGIYALLRGGAWPRWHLGAADALREEAARHGAARATGTRDAGEAPIPWTRATWPAGARVYVQHCAVCHGLPGGKQTAIAEGEFPKPRTSSVARA